MAIRDVVILVLVAVGVTGTVAGALCWRALRNLRRKYHMLQRLLLEQAELREMSLEAYTAMLREARRHNGSQQL